MATPTRSASMKRFAGEEGAVSVKHKDRLSCKPVHGMKCCSETKTVKLEVLSEDIPCAVLCIM